MESDPFKEAEEAQKIGALEGTSLDSADHLYARERSRIRLHVTKVVIWTYAFVLGAIIVYLIWRSIWYGDSVFEELIELVKIALLPVVTFVIGHYFGSSR